MIIYARELFRGIDHNLNFAVSRLPDFSKYETVQIPMMELLRTEKPDVQSILLEKAVEVLKVTSDDVRIELQEGFGNEVRIR